MISIIITIKNETKFLLNVLKQLYPQYPNEVIIVDGHSTDDHINYYKTLQRIYGFKLIKNKYDDSPFGAFLTGLEEAKNEYVSLWSVDDDPYPDYLKRMTEALTYNPDIVICSCDVARENERYKRTLYPFDCYVSPECFAKNFKTFGHRINLVGSVIRKSIVQECPQTHVNFDATYFFYTAFSIGVFNIGKPLLLYRSYLNSPGQLGKWKDKKKWIEVSQRFFKKKGVYDVALKAGLWKRERFHNIKLMLFPKLPLWLRKMYYKKLYKYDCREEK